MSEADLNGAREIGLPTMWDLTWIHSTERIAWLARKWGGGGWPPVDDCSWLLTLDSDADNTQDLLSLLTRPFPYGMHVSAADGTRNQGRQPRCDHPMSPRVDLLCALLSQYLRVALGCRFHVCTGPLRQAHPWHMEGSTGGSSVARQAASQFEIPVGLVLYVIDGCISRPSPQPTEKPWVTSFTSAFVDSAMWRSAAAKRKDGEMNRLASRVTSSHEAKNFIGIGWVSREEQSPYFACDGGHLWDILYLPPIVDFSRVGRPLVPVTRRAPRTIQDHVFHGIQNWIAQESACRRICVPAGGMSANIMIWWICEHYFVFAHHLGQTHFPNPKEWTQEREEGLFLHGFRDGNCLESDERVKEIAGQNNNPRSLHNTAFGLNTCIRAYGVQNRVARPVLPAVPPWTASRSVNLPLIPFMIQPYGPALSPSAQAQQAGTSDEEWVSGNEWLRIGLNASNAIPPPSMIRTKPQREIERAVICLLEYSSNGLR
ncbi:hypothetical protein SODALDRAFT_378475 [Sodiomyces alkalinus F11]|uniref:Uncharacterized protein n=1 Tax=Sodiomyces alkalinus (strain CBS 110278 / VKM F-3762 / F11) TaxID=1314773 RepID=A0A3N2PXX2_SODAK|nr:hypothetical protein SODALDRAFT_378475 [Sodiomyces alkalinus F11]ROT39379.1 hypothetical protein SODALDRAFT_378475 [Sodiomyces alkalinus F11]